MPTPVILKLLTLALAGMIALTPVQLAEIHKAGTANKIINKLERKTIEKAKEKGKELNDPNYKPPKPKPKPQPLTPTGIPYKELFKHFGLF